MGLVCYFAFQMGVRAEVSLPCLPISNLSPPPFILDAKGKEISI